MKFNIKYAAKITLHLGTWSKSFGWAGGKEPELGLLAVGPATIPIKVLAVGVTIEIGVNIGTGEAPV